MQGIKESHQALLDQCVPQGSPGVIPEPKAVGTARRGAGLLCCAHQLWASLSTGILVLISASLIPKSDARWVKNQCDCAEAFPKVQESKELLHCSKGRMKSWLKSFAVMFFAEHHSQPSGLPPSSLCRAAVPLSSQMCPEESPLCCVPLCKCSQTVCTISLSPLTVPVLLTCGKRR